MIRVLSIGALCLLVQLAHAQTYQRQGNPFNVQAPPYTAACDGATDDTSAIQRALNDAAALSHGGVVVIPNATCLSTTGITVPPGVSLQGAAFIGGVDPTLYGGGSRILCPINLPNPCVRVGVVNGAPGTGSVSSLIIQGTGSAALTSGAGLMVDGVFNVSLNQVMVFNFYQGYYWKAYSESGLGGKMWQAYSGRIRNAHLVVDSWPELQIAQSRFGVNGLSDLGANTYVRFQTAPHRNPAAGVNTFDCINCQFNEGHGGVPVNHWLEFVNCISPTPPSGPPPACFPTEDVEIFRFTNNHIENVNYGIFSDATWQTIYDFKLTSSSLVVFKDILSQLNTATNLIAFGLTASKIFGPLTLNETTQTRGLSFLGNYFTHPVTLNGGASSGSNGSRIMAAGNSFQNGLSINGNNWFSIDLHGNEGTFESMPTAALTSNVMQFDASVGRAVIAGGSATLTLTNVGQPVDGKNWDLFTDANGAFNLRALNDAYSASTNVISCGRSGPTATGCSIQFPAVATPGTGTQTLANSPCSAPTVTRWVPITIAGQASPTWFVPACQ